MVLAIGDGSDILCCLTILQGLVGQDENVVKLP